jgi:glycyl-tRNA synthetase beta chain
LIGFWINDERPTGSGDPFALRRANLGISRIILQTSARVSFLKLFRTIIDSPDMRPPIAKAMKRDDLHTDIFERYANDLLAFFADRLKVYLKDQGARHDLIDAVFSLGGQDDLLMIVRRVEALSKFLESDDGKNLLAGVKRASNILKIEEKKDGRSYHGAIIQAQLVKGEERALNSAITVAIGQATRAVEAEDFGTAMAAIAKLRPHVDAFFDQVIVNEKNQSFRENRLNLLNRIRAATLAVADFPKIEG